MYQKCTDLWHTLSAAEQQTWESQARRQHMTGYSYYMSLCLRPNPGIYLPLAGGTMQGDIDMATAKLLNLSAPTADEEPSRKLDLATHATLSSGVHNAGSGNLIATDSDGIMTLPGQSGCAVYRATSYQSIPSATFTYVQLNGVDFDVQSEFDPVTTFRYTAKKSGLYIVSVYGYLRLIATSKFFGVYIVRNGVAIGSNGVNTDATWDANKANLTIPVALAIGNYVQFGIYHLDTVARNLQYGITNTGMGILKVA